MQSEKSTALPHMSKRLYALAKMVGSPPLRGAMHRGNPDFILADIGCDHGWLSIYLLENGLCSKVIATDVHSGPLERAKEHICEAHLEAYIETRLSDGLQGLKPGEVHSIVIAGMGGNTMTRILRQGESFAKSAEELILQPQSGIMEFRKFLEESGYPIFQEDMLCEDGKYYPIIKAVPNSAGTVTDGDESAGFSSHFPKELDWKYGPKLLAEKHPVLKAYVLWRKEKLEEIVDHLRSHGTQEVKEKRTNELLREIKELEFAQKILEE